MIIKWSQLLYIDRILWTIPFHEAHFKLGSLIPYSAIATTVLLKSRIFHIFTRVENQPLKLRLKQKRTHY